MRFLDFSTDRETPVVSIKFRRFEHVIAHEEVRHRREPGVEILDRTFEIDEAERTKNHAIFARKIDGLPLRESPGQDRGSRGGQDRRS